MILTTRISRSAETAHTGPGSRLVVTGAARFIDHHLVRALQDRGDEVLVIDDLSGESVPVLIRLNGR